MDMVQDDRTPLQNIMDVEDIEKWIQDPDYAAKCWKSGDAINISPDDILDNMYQNRDMDKEYEQIRKELWIRKSELTKYKEWYRYEIQWRKKTYGKKQGSDRIQLLPSFVITKDGEKQ